MAFTSLLVTFDKKEGWRVRGHAPYDDSIRVVHIEGIKFLHIPVISEKSSKAGRFCNPRKLVFQHFYEKRPNLKT
jgi:hypothetical protein